MFLKNRKSHFFLIFIATYLKFNNPGFFKKRFYYGNQPLINKFMNCEVVKTGNIRDIYFGILMLRPIPPKF